MSEDIKHTPEGAEDFKSEESTEENNVKGTDVTDVYGLEEREKNLNELSKTFETTREDLSRIETIGSISQCAEKAWDELDGVVGYFYNLARFHDKAAKKFWVEGDDTDASGDRPNIVQTKPMSEIVLSLEDFSEEEKARFSEAIKLIVELQGKLKVVERDVLNKIPSKFLVKKGGGWFLRDDMRFGDRDSSEDSPIAEAYKHHNMEEKVVRDELYDARWQEVQGPKSDEPKDEKK